MSAYIYLSVHKVIYYFDKCDNIIQIDMLEELETQEKESIFWDLGFPSQDHFGLQAAWRHVDHAGRRGSDDAMSQQEGRTFAPALQGEESREASPVLAAAVETWGKPATDQFAQQRCSCKWPTRNSVKGLQKEMTWV